MERLGFLLAADEEKKQLSWVFCVRDLEFLIQTLEKHGKTDSPVRLIVIDTLQAVIEGGGINTGIGPMGMVMRMTEEIGKRYGASVIWLHHSLKKDTDVAAASAEITRVTSSNHYLELTEKTDASGRLIAKLQTKKHRGTPPRTTHYVLDKTEGVQLAKFADDSATHDQELLMELWRENRAISPATLVENLGHLQMTRSEVRSRLSRLRREKDWTRTDNNGHWALTTSGREHVEKLAEEQNTFNWDSDLAEFNQSKVAA